jgi:hypothetical protein
LAIDYECQSDIGVYLTKDEIKLFVELGAFCWQHYREASPDTAFPYFVWDRTALRDTRVQTEILDPANSLGIGDGVVVTFLYYFVRSFGRSVEDEELKVWPWLIESSFNHIRTHYGMQAIVWRLLYERKTLLPALMTMDSKRQRMIETLSR